MNKPHYIRTVAELMKALSRKKQCVIQCKFLEDSVYWVYVKVQALLSVFQLLHHKGSDTPAVPGHAHNLHCHGYKSVIYISPLKSIPCANIHMYQPCSQARSKQKEQHKTGNVWDSSLM